MEEESKTKKDVLLNITSNFQKNIYGLRHLVNDLYSVAQEHDKESQNTRLSFESKVKSVLLSSLDNMTKPGKYVTEERFDDACQGIIDLMERYDHANINYKFIDSRAPQLLSSAFIMLVGHFDFLLSNLIHSYYDKYPEALSKQSLLTFEELKECSSIDEAIDFLIAKKVESISFKPFGEQMLFFKNELSVPLHNDATIWNPIQELILRRNVLVHNNGMANTRYIKGVANFQIQTPIKGTTLFVDHIYFESSFISIFIGGIILTQKCWRKWFPKEVSDADLKLYSLINALLMIRDYETAIRLTIFSKQIEAANEANRHFLDLLHCFTLKSLGKDSDFNVEIAKLEKAALSLRCYVQLLAVKGFRKEFYENLKIAVQKNEMYKGELLHSALYSDFRQDEDFYNQLDEIFGN